MDPASQPAYVPDPQIAWIDSVPLTRAQLVDAIEKLKELDGDKRIEPAMEAINSPLFHMDRNRRNRHAIEQWNKKWRGHPQDAPKALPGHRLAKRRIGFIDLLQEKLQELDQEANSPANMEMAAIQGQVWHNEPVEEPIDDAAARKYALTLVSLREGQPAFRADLMAAYSYRCVVTDCDALQALEAAHIRPYHGPASNAISNGLLLRADIHTLFDRNLLAIDSKTREVCLAPPLSMTQYQAFSGHRIPNPREEWQRPSQDLLSERWEQFQQAWS